MTRIAAAVVCVATMMVGCTQTSSDGIATGNFFTEYDVWREGTKVVARAAYFVGSGNTGTVIELSSEESITCNGVKLVKKTSVANQVWYEAELAPSDTDYVFELKRGSGETVTSKVPAPAALVLQKPATSTDLTFADHLELSWAPSGTEDKVTVSANPVSGPCIARSLGSGLPDNGSTSVDLAPLKPSEPTESCAMTLTVSRGKEQPLGSPFQGGRISSSTAAGFDIVIH